MSSGFFHAIPFRKLFRFGLTGVFVTGVHALIVILLIEGLSAAAPLANGIAFVCATLVSFVINTLWSFAKPMQKKTLVRFVTVACIGLVAAVLISWGVQEVGLAYLWGVLAVSVFVPPITFLLHNFWTYR